MAGSSSKAFSTKRHRRFAMSSSNMSYAQFRTALVQCNASALRVHQLALIALNRAFNAESSFLELFCSRAETYSALRQYKGLAYAVSSEWGIANNYDGNTKSWKFASVEKPTESFLLFRAAVKSELKASRGERSQTLSKLLAQGNKARAASAQKAAAPTKSSAPMQGAELSPLMSLTKKQLIERLLQAEKTCTQLRLDLDAAHKRCRELENAVINK